MVWMHLVIIVKFNTINNMGRNRYNRCKIRIIVDKRLKILVYNLYHYDNNN